jgi:hypothetical protein
MNKFIDLDGSFAKMAETQQKKDKELKKKIEELEKTMKAYEEKQKEKK